ncbi:MAG: RHS repeat-associated core domain-containing protein, partial [Arenimonas sp.]
LGRVTKVMQDSELGLLTSTTEYLSGFKTKTTNPRQFYTLTEYMAWDSPNTSLPMRIESAEDVLTEFTRDNFGKPLSVKRSSLSDSTISNSRIYAYDAQQRLCQRTEPESGTTVISYDPVGNMLWSAPGQTVASTTSCNQSAVPTQARIVRSYDKLDRLKTVDVPNSVNDLAYHYIAGGLLQSLSNGGSGASGVVWNYTYNKLGLPVTETLNFDNLTKVIHHRYNADGVEDQLTLPSALTIAYTPNALGQATQSGTFATNAKYRSNGAIAEFTYGNNVLHKQLLNLRGLPAERKDSFSGALLQQEIVAFDVSGNVLCMRDNTSGSGGHRDMQYDAQDRLVNTYAPNQWWVNASTGYDVLDNIRTSTVGNRKHTYIYDANQRLTKITKPLGNDPSPQNVNALMTCNNIALNEDIGTISPEGSGTIEPPNTGGTTTPPGSGGNPPGGGGCQFACGGGGQQQNAIGGSDGGEEFSQSSMMAMSSAGGGGDDIPGAPITVYQFTQDANGNTVSGRHAAVFDALNRVTEITGIEQYQYDGHGRRVKTKRLSDNKINYSVYDLSGRLLTEDDARTNKKTDYIHFNGRLVAERSAALTGTTAQTTTYVNSYLHTDSLGSPVAKTSQTGAITKIERYTPYGEPSDQTYDQGPGYTGHVTDSLTGLSYAQQRYYDPLIGRFLSVDPIETDPNTGASFNRYNYANNNPYKFTDPDGRDAAERFVEQHRADMQSGNGKIYEPFEKPVVIVTGTMLAATPLIGPIASLIFRQRITSEVKPLNGNSKNSPKEQHRYEISDKDGDVVKTGISGKALNKDGTSGRANVQVNSLNKTEGPGSYTATVKETGIPGRRAALEAEKAATKELKSEGNTLRLQQRPKPE